MGDIKIKILEAKYEAKLEFPRGGGGGGCKTKNLPWGKYGCFLELRNMSQSEDFWSHCSVTMLVKNINYRIGLLGWPFEFCPWLVDG